MATAQLPASSRSSRLADDAATAALYVTHPERKAPIRNSTATEEFNPRVTGSSPNLSRASASAALLAHARSKPVEIWRPGRLPAAEKAALCVKDYTPPEIPMPKPSTEYSAEGLEAAVLAVRDQKSVASLPPTATGPEQDISVRAAVGGHPQEKARLAATGAYARARADSGLGESEASHARSAAERARVEDEDQLAHTDRANEASRIQHAHTNARLYTSSPPVATEVKERNHRNSLRAAAIVMAKDMHDVPDTVNTGVTDTALSAAQKGQYQARSRKAVSGEADRTTTLRQAIALQDAAQKRAAEKLAQMKDPNAEYLEYYGTTPQPQQSRWATRRKRTSSDADSAEVDVERSRHIRSQMFSLQKKMNRVDNQREKDRELLMKAAQRNVDATMQDLEMKVYADTGRPTPSVLKEWDKVAQGRARKEIETAEATGGVQGEQVNIGTHQYMDMADVEAVARSRLQPALDEITDQAETQRAHDVEARLDEEEQKRHAAVERQREADLRAEEKRQKKGAAKEVTKPEAKGKKLFPAGLFRMRTKRGRIGKPIAQEAPTQEGVAAVQEVPAAQEAGPEQEASTAEGGLSREAHGQIAADEPEGAASAIAAAAQPKTPAAEGEGGFSGEAYGQKAADEPEGAASAIAAAAQTKTPAADGEGGFSRESQGRTGADEPEGAATMQVAAMAPIAKPTTLPTSEDMQRDTSLPEIEDYDNTAITASGAADMRNSHPITSPRADRKLTTWFRDRLIRRSSDGPVAVYPHQPGPEFATDSESGFTGGAALTRKDEPRGAALSSHPVTGADLEPHDTRHSGNNVGNVEGRAMSPTEEETVEPPPAQQNGGGKRNRLRRSFMKSVSRTTQESKTDGVTKDSGEGSQTLSDSKSRDVQGLRNSAVEQGLPVPPALGEAPSTGRESRFSEDL
ncbi:hypothetical protein N7474_006160 [Penicillium riverlandense]|uniref:uncharacterized protein n=1 Tax=Penicillium riverlandense TaxID=1903569 RepID=UPI00254875B2|nr:uncharacterized protein N7474_006160 [Penicillium riverlandense]KAJ5820569.1 hypothetical protein N7474_006160 [Penicillium riverlandense]